MLGSRRVETGFPTPAHPVWDALEISLRSAMSEALLGQKPPKQALDELTRDWQRNLRRAGVGSRDGYLHQGPNLAPIGRCDRGNIVLSPIPARLGQSAPPPAAPESPAPLADR